MKRFRRFERRGCLPENQPQAIFRRMRAASRFPENTCGASRHVAMAGEHLCRGEPYPQITEEPEHIGSNMMIVVALLWEARTRIAELEARIQVPAREEGK